MLLGCYCCRCTDMYEYSISVFPGLASSTTRDRSRIRVHIATFGDSEVTNRWYV